MLHVPFILILLTILLTSGSTSYPQYYQNDYNAMNYYPDEYEPNRVYSYGIQFGNTQNEQEKRKDSYDLSKEEEKRLSMDKSIMRNDPYPDTRFNEEPRNEKPFNDRNSRGNSNEDLGTFGEARNSKAMNENPSKRLNNVNSGPKSQFIMNESFQNDHDEMME